MSTPHLLDAESIRKQLDRIIRSPTFAQSERLCRFLRFTVDETLAGRAEQLEESVIGMEVFDRSPALIGRDETIVRVEARRLRAKLEHYYSGEGNADPVRITLPKIGYVPAFATTPGAGPALWTRRWLWLAAATTAVVLVAAALWIWRMRSVPAGQAAQLKRLTFDEGLASSPSLSGDGRLVAFASDRAGRGDLDIWVQQLSGGDPVRITTHSADDYDPDISADGSRLAFRSERDGGGIYVVSSLGGDELVVSRQGSRPRLSPDGQTIAYHSGNPALDTGLPNKVYTIPVSGGEPRQAAPELDLAWVAIWSPDGKALLISGCKHGECDWWVVPLDGGAPVPTRSFGVMRSTGLWGFPLGTGSWRTDGKTDHILFSARSGNSTNLWEFELEASTHQFRAGPKRITLGSGTEVSPTYANGRLAFASIRSSSGIWSVPVEAITGKVLGPPEKFSQTPAEEYNPSISLDGRRMVYMSARSGEREVWVADVEKHRAQRLTDDAQLKARAVISPDGSQVVFTRLDSPIDTNLWRMSSFGGSVRRIWPSSYVPDLMLLDWAPDGKTLVCYTAPPTRFGLLDIATGHFEEILSHPKRDLFRARMSPDQRWVAFHVQSDARGSTLYVAPVEQTPPPESRWIPIAEPPSGNVHPFWSPDGSLLYFVSNRDGFYCIWAQGWETGSGRPLGPPREVLHLHTAARSLANLNMGSWGLTLARNRLVFALGEKSGSLWTLEPYR